MRSYNYDTYRKQVERKQTSKYTNYDHPDR
jgi:hypothetical protein